ncbi:MAG: hypothetical protein GWN61_06680, partial [candidate division Zixibacteria bacterium]|nr:hypothetical protein [candidate division Zixibacteria bacterium]NIV05868.1 hypothetical protein [candidate division Zixibacteria bacterium]
MIEYESNGGRLLSIGGFIHFDKPHLLQLHMERFVKDVLNYLAAEPEDTQPTYWLNEDTKPRQFSVSSSPLKPGKGRSLRAREQTELLLTRELATDNFFDVSGRRCLIMGKETGEIDEVWVHPFRVLRDFQIGIVDGDSVTWLKDL